MPNGPTQEEKNARSEHGAFGSRHSSSEFEHDYREHEQSWASTMGNAVRRVLGKIMRVVRNPENDVRSEHPAPTQTNDSATINSQDAGQAGENTGRS